MARALRANVPALENESFVSTLAEHARSSPTTMPIRRRVPLNAKAAAIVTSVALTLTGAAYASGLLAPTPPTHSNLPSPGTDEPAERERELRGPRMVDESDRTNPAPRGEEKAHDKTDARSQETDPPSSLETGPPDAGNEQGPSPEVPPTGPQPPSPSNSQPDEDDTEHEGPDGSDDDSDESDDDDRGDSDDDADETGDDSDHPNDDSGNDGSGSKDDNEAEGDDAEAEDDRAGSSRKVDDPSDED